MNVSSNVNIPIDQIFDDLLEGDVTLGSENIFSDKFFARPGNQPIALRLREIFNELGQPMPKELGLYEMFEVWLVPHRVSITRQPGSIAEVTSVGLQIEYDHGDSTCSILSLIPAPQFIHHGRIAFGGILQGNVNANGDISPAPEDFQFKKKQNLGILNIGLLASGEVGFSFNASVVTPLISAVGIGASCCEWNFGKHNEPIFGKDIETWTVLALPKKQSTLTYRLRYYICWRTCFVTTRRQTKWIDITCILT